MFSRKKKFFVLSIAFLCLSCLIFTGCSKNNNTQQTPPATNNQTDNTQNNVSDDNNAMEQKDNKDAEDNVDNTDLHQRAEKIADAVARTVISEKMAYVSVAIDETADTAESATLKEEISQVVKKTDAEIETVYVMEDADTFTRMKEIGEDIANGKPVSGFVEELENMFVRVTPTKE